MALSVTLLLLSSAIYQTVHSVDSVTTDGCGVTMGCVRDPSGCVSPNCRAIVKWRPDNGVVAFEMMGVTSGWVAVAFSTDTSMGDDSVIHCLSNAVSLSYTEGGYSYRLTSIADPGGVLSNASSSSVGGEIHCRFARAVAGQSGNQIKPLNANYYIFLGVGPLNGGSPAKHERTPSISPAKIDVTAALSSPPTGSTVASASPTSSSSTGPSASPTPSASAGPSTSQMTPPSTGGSFEPISGADNAKVHYVKVGDYVSFNMTGPASYVAVGFSKDQQMGDDSVIACSWSSNQNKVLVQNWYNEGRSLIDVANPSDGIASPSGTYNNGAVSCQFKRKISGFVDTQHVFDLNQTYYLLLVYGSSDSTGRPGYHGQKRSVSDSTVNVTKGEATTGESKAKNANLLKAHGCLMITAWVLLVSPAIMLARYFRTSWPGSKICKVDIWFAVHRMLLLLALACTIAGFIIIFVYVSAEAPDMATYPPGSPSYFWAHGPLGIVAMIIIILNPIISAARCGPDSPYRPIFNWIHWIIGTGGYVIAMITLFFGAKIGETDGYKMSHVAIFWILVAFVAYHATTEIVLALFRFMEEDTLKRNLMRKQSYELQRIGERTKLTPPAVSRPGLIFRYVMLTLYGIVTLGLWLAMIILIGSGRV